MVSVGSCTSGSKLSGALRAGSLATKEVRAVTNNQLCNVIGITGCAVASFCMGLMFFGMTAAMWGTIAGIVLAGIALVNYD